MTMNMSRFVKMVIGHEAKWGPIPQTTCTLVSDSGVGFPHPVLMMAAILVVVHTKGLRVFGGITIGGMVGLDIFLLAFVSGDHEPGTLVGPCIDVCVMGNLGNTGLPRLSAHQ
jgi:aquaporin Z